MTPTPFPNPVLFADLDDSLLQTAAKCRSGTAAVAAHDRHGQPLSYHTAEQLDLLALFRDATIVPVTGRNREALERVVSPVFRSVRITSHGALVLDAAGRLLPDWASQLDPAVQLWAPRLEEALAQTRRIIARTGWTLRARLIEDAGRPVYVSIKGEAAELDALAAPLAPLWIEGTLHRNGHNLALLPPFADKAAAVYHVMRTWPATPRPPLFIGLGDSLTDLPFLRLCHFAMTPRDTQIQTLRWT